VEALARAALTRFVDLVVDAGRLGSVSLVMEALVDACAECVSATQVSFLLAEYEHGVLRTALAGRPRR